MSQIIITPLISIITVSLNAAQFIEQTIRSVLSQTYPHIEYIIIDGGSRDGTVGIIRKYAHRLAYWHSRPDRGLAHAFNLGLAQAHGEWILFLNADDFFISPKVLEAMVPHLSSDKETYVVFGKVVFVSREKELQLILRNSLGYPWRWEEFRRYCTIPHPGAFTNRRYFERIGKFDERLRVAVDYELFLRGGKELQPQFVPITISAMRTGGMSTKYLLRALNENKWAQEINHALPKELAWANLYWLILYNLFCGIAHMLFDPLASKIGFLRRVLGVYFN